MMRPMIAVKFDLDEEDCAVVIRAGGFFDLVVTPALVARDPLLAALPWSVSLGMACGELLQKENAHVLREMLLLSQERSERARKARES